MMASMTAIGMTLVMIKIKLLRIMIAPLPTKNPKESGISVSVIVLFGLVLGLVHRNVLTSFSSALCGLLGSLTP